MKKSTNLIKTGRKAKSAPKTVNLPVTRASTVVFESLAELEAIQKKFDADEVVPTYGILNMPLRAAFEELMVEIEGGYRAATFASGLAANAAALLTCVKAGDHVLMVDSVYGPTRRLCDRTLPRFGVETTYYDPLVGESIASLLKPNTRVVYLESPGSHTFEVQDVPAIVRVAKQHGAAVIHDNTWATGLFFPAFEYGVDLVVQAGTKYPAGHSDVLIGTIVANKEWWPRLRDLARDLGQTASPDDIFLAMRGIRTLDVRLRRHEQSALTVARWLQTRPEVARVLHPALESDPGYVLWKRDFKGSTGLFAIEFPKGTTRAQLAAFIDHLEHFAIGYSWGGYESLAVVAYWSRSAKPWLGGPIVRLHIGLEDPEDLIADLAQGLARMHAA